MGTPRSNSGARRGATTTLLGAIGALLLTGCIDSATDDSTDTTLVPLVAPNFVTLAPATTTTLVAADATTTTPPPNVNTGGTVATTPPVPTAAPAATTTTAARTPSTATGGGSYTVAANDTVYGIARKYGITADALADLNGWSDGPAHNIYPGDAIEVPDGAPATTAAGSATTTTVKAGATTTTVAAGGSTYVIKQGDYLALIARNTGTTIDAIVEVNGWSDGANHLLIPGQSIKLPARAG